MKLYKSHYLHIINNVETVDKLQRVLDCASVDLNVSEWQQVCDAARPIRCRLIEEGRF